MKTGGTLVVIFMLLAFSVILLIMAVATDQSPIEMWKSISWPKPYQIKRFAAEHWWLLTFFAVSFVAFVFAMARWLNADENAAMQAKETSFQTRLHEYKAYYDRFIVRQFSNKK